MRSPPPCTPRATQTVLSKFPSGALGFKARESSKTHKSLHKKRRQTKVSNHGFPIGARWEASLFTIVCCAAQSAVSVATVPYIPAPPSETPGCSLPLRSSSLSRKPPTGLMAQQALRCTTPHEWACVEPKHFVFASLLRLTYPTTHGNPKDARGTGRCTIHKSGR